MNIFENCPCIKYDKDTKSYKYNTAGNSGCQSITAIASEYKAKAKNSVQK